ncbi:MAG: hypothetical protein NTZ52_06245 [Chlamydiae bacterium]|nr:hypothetical protein [Chlamydiota bacterium]
MPISTNQLYIVSGAMVAGGLAGSGISLYCHREDVKEAKAAIMDSVLLGIGASLAVGVVSLGNRCSRYDLGRAMALGGLVGSGTSIYCHQNTWKQAKTVIMDSVQVGIGVGLAAGIGTIFFGILNLRNR